MALKRIVLGKTGVSHADHSCMLETFGEKLQALEKKTVKRVSTLFIRKLTVAQRTENQEI